MASHRWTGARRRTAGLVAGVLVVVGGIVGALLVQNSAGASGTSTRQVQWDLAALGYLPWSGIDGANGPQTKAAVRSFQADRCLSVDGVAGPHTDGALSSVVSSVQGKAGATRGGTPTTTGSWERTGRTEGPRSHPPR